MKRLIILFIILFITIITFSLFISYQNFFKNIIETLNIWLYKVYPSIFTFYILASLLINTNLLNKLIYLFKPVLKRLKFPNDKSLNIFIISIFTGNPSSSLLISESLDKGEISINDAHNLLKCSSFLNPIFIYSFLIIYQIKYIYLIIIIHLFSNFIIARLINRSNNNTIINNTNIFFSIDNLVSSINNIVHLLLLISGIMVFANIFNYSLNCCLNYFKFNHILFKFLLANIEVAGGLHSIINLHLSEGLSLALITFVCAFGGFSIHLQVLSVIRKHHLSYRIFFQYRLVQAIIGVVLFLFIYQIK